MSLTGLEAVIFDLDDTLCHYEISVSEAIRCTLARTSQQPDLVGDVEQAGARYKELWHEKILVDEKFPTLRERIWSRLLCEQGIDNPDLVERLASYYTRIRVSSLKMLSGASDLLERLHEGYSTGLLTNGPSEPQWEKIKLLEIEHLFDEIVVSGDVGFHKPDARAFSVLLSRLRTSSDRALYIGNSYTADVVGAKRTGMKVVWIKDSKDMEFVDKCFPDYQIGKLEELRELLL